MIYGDHPEVISLIDKHGDAITKLITSKEVCDHYEGDLDFFEEWPWLKAKIEEVTGPLTEVQEEWLEGDIEDWYHNGNLHTFEDGDPSGFGIVPEELLAW
jgi:hypothetical protein